MHLTKATRIVAICGMLLTSYGVSGQAFEAESFRDSLTKIVEKVQEPGAYKGRIALDFANYFNGVSSQNPTEHAEMSEIAHEVAEGFQLEYDMSGSIIASAQFIDNNEDSDTDRQPTGSASAPKVPVRKEIFKVVEQMPRFPGCEEMQGSNEEKKACADALMMEFIYSNLVYPVEALRKGIEGRTVVQFIVKKVG